MLTFEQELAEAIERAAKQSPDDFAAAFDEAEMEKTYVASYLRNPAQVEGVEVL